MAIKKVSKNTDSLHYKLFRGLLVGFLLAPIIIGCLMVGSQLFGYRFASNHGTSMEPTLSDGDMLWTKRVPIADVNIGDQPISIEGAGEIVAWKWKNIKKQFLENTA